MGEKIKELAKILKFTIQNVSIKSFMQFLLKLFIV